MKKILISTILASAVVLSSCEDNLDIPQKGVTAMENFYQTDAHAEEAMVAAYQGFLWNICSREGGSIYAPFRFCFNLCGDDLFAAGEFLGDNDFTGAMNEFRYDSGSEVIRNCYNNIYYAMYYSNIVIDKFKDGLPNGGVTPTTKRVVAEARVLRAYMHMMLALGWGTPPLVDHLLAGSDLPSNYEGTQKELLEWCAKECEEVVGDLDKRNGKNDKNGAAKVTKGFAYAVAGKAYLYAGDYSQAKSNLEQVINSGDYDLVPGEKWADLFHAEGDLNEEKIFEANLSRNENVGVYWDHINRSTWMEANIWNWRSDHYNLNPSTNYSSIDGWGGCGVPKTFADEFVANDGLDSYRLNGSIVSIEDLVYGKLAPYGVDNVDKMTLEEKKKSKEIGLQERGVYGQSLYLPLKPVCRINDLTTRGENCRLNNFTIMRYAEVLLMYAECCVQTGDAAKALQYVNAIQKRAGSKTISSSVDLNVIKKEKKLEMWLEGVRWIDMVRWGDFDLAKKAGTQVTTAYDKLTRPIKGSDKVCEEHDRFYTVFSPEAAPGAPGRGVTGFQSGKHELFPFPNTVLSLNPNIKQNPGWE